MNPNVINILGVWTLATQGEIQHGLRWYAQASGEACRRLAGLTKEAALGVVAALSPQTHWARNIRYAEQLVETGNAPSTGARIAKAKAILEGANPLSLLNGSWGGGYGKESNFWRCLMDQTTDAVCVDGHAYSIWAGERIETSKTPSISKNLYKVIEADYQEAARHLGVKPHQCQAVTWLVWKRIHGVRKEIDRIAADRNNGTVYFGFMYEG